VWLIDLAPLTEPTLVAQTVASVLDIRQAANRSLIETLSDQLRPRRTLLVLDNCEHLIASSAELAETLLRSAASLTILATSREALRIAGETMWRVPSLTLPDPEDALSPEDLLQYEAVRLLAERAAAIDSGFAMTGDNARTVADVCRRLDGIPLAIELAAARLNVLTIASDCSRGRRGRRWGDSEHSKRPSTGATSCCRTPNVICCGGCRVSRGDGRSTPPSRCAQVTVLTATMCSNCCHT
jgi:predicted ATPase